MFRKHFSKLIVLALAFSLFGCKDFIEKNISKDTPVLILPANNSTLLANPVHVKWEELEGATKYRVEIVSPEFGNIQSFPVDSIVTGTNFYIGLDSAQYEIRITAMNAGYNSHTSDIKRFWVGTSQGGSNSSITLTSPAAGAYYNESFPGIFSWNPLSSGSVQSYYFELHKTSTFSGQLLEVQDQINTVSIQSMTGTDLAEGTYSWGVKAFYTDNSETTFSKRVFYIDKTLPGLASLTTPANNAIVSVGDVTFNWTLPADVGTIQSPRTSKIQIAHDTGFTNLVGNFNFETATTATMQSMTSGVYYWRVLVKDDAGNLGATPSTYNTLNVQ